MSLHSRLAVCRFKSVVQRLISTAGTQVSSQMPPVWFLSPIFFFCYAFCDPSVQKKHRRDSLSVADTAAVIACKISCLQPPLGDQCRTVENRDVGSASFAFRSFLCNFPADLEDSVMANLLVFRFIWDLGGNFKQPSGLCPKKIFLKTKPFREKKQTWWLEEPSICSISPLAWMLQPAISARRWLPRGGLLRAALFNLTLARRGREQSGNASAEKSLRWCFYILTKPPEPPSLCSSSSSSSQARRCSLRFRLLSPSGPFYNNNCDRQRVR